MVRTIVAVMATGLLSACVHEPTEPDPIRAETCQVMERSLSADIEIQTGGFLVGSGAEVRVRYDFANDISEQNLVALQAMYANCALWAAGRASDEEFTEALLQHGGVYAAYRQIDELGADQTKLSERLDRLQEVFEQTSIRFSPRELDTIRANAERLALVEADGQDTQRMIQAMQQEIKSANDEYRASLDANDVAVAERQAEFASVRTELELVTSRVEFLDRNLDELSQAFGALPQPSSDLIGRTYVPIYFDTLEFDLDQAARKQIDDFVSLVPAGNRFRVTGFADEEGREEGNLALSRARAYQVESYLESQGKEVVSSNGQGSTDTFGIELPSNRVVLIDVVSQ